MKTLKIVLGVGLLFLIVALTGIKKKYTYSNLKGGESKIETPIALD